MTPAMAYLVKLLTAETPGCRKCADPVRGPLSHEHNDGDCRQMLGWALLTVREEFLAALKESA